MQQSRGTNGFAHGQEAIDSLNQLMWDRRDTTTVVLAGYPEEMDALLETNSGLRSRIGFVIEFGDYEPDHLVQIFEKRASSKNYEVTGEALDILRQRVPILSKDPGFCNARAMVNLFAHVLVWKTEGRQNKIIDADDMVRALNDKVFRPKEKSPVGFSM